MSLLVGVAAGCGDEGEASRGEADDSDRPAFSIKVRGGEEVGHLPDIEGENLGGSKLGDRLILTGVDEQARFDLYLLVGDALRMQDYHPIQLNVSWSDLDWNCVGGGDRITVTVTSLQPLRGTYAGDVACYASQSAANFVDAHIAGVFNATI